jgi:hypothetical protein
MDSGDAEAAHALEAIPGVASSNPGQGHERKDRPAGAIQNEKFNSR